MECMRNNFTEGALLDGRYITVCPLNHGSFGMVFKARDVNTGELVALKCLTKASAASIAAPAFAIDDRSEELAIHRHIGDHPNIVNLLHHFETEHHIYLVLEYCQNGDLYEAIRVGRGPGQTEHVREALLQLLDAVEYMHSKNVYHRDIKPENIFLSANGAMKVGDFGLATMESTSFESAVGSDRYMAPEQMEPASTGYNPAKADVWAIGICILNILFSRNPFATPTLSDPLFSDFASDRQTLFDVFPNMSQDTFEILVHCLALEPESRSLAAARYAIKKAICFTTEDESLDDFCGNAASVAPASANREPLRTPSISSPQLDTIGAFPWAKALAMTPPVRQLSVIPDNELELFPELPGEAWPVEPIQPDNASAVSFVDSGLGVSLKSTNLSVPRSKPLPISGSLPISMARPGGSMAAVFGRRKEFESKSWSDLWDEEEEEQAAHSDAENDHYNVFTRDPSIPSLGNESSGSDTPRAGLTEVKDPSQLLNSRNRIPEKLANVDYRVSEHTGFLFEDERHDSSAVKHPISPLTPKYSPPSKRSSPDKWSALGERRRAMLESKAEAKAEPANVSLTETTPTPSAVHAARKRGRAGSWRQNVNWSIWGQGHQKAAPTTTISGNETSPVLPPTKKDWMKNDWRKQEEKPLPEAQVDAGRSGRPFEWVWRM